MARSPQVSHALWTLVGASSLAACGRLGFDGSAIESMDAASDAAVDAAEIDGGTPMLVVPDLVEMDAICGERTQQALTLVNAGTATLVISAVDFDSDGFSAVSELPIAIAPGAQADLVIRAPGPVIGTDVPGDTKSTTATFTTNAGDRRVDIIATVHGAQFEVHDGTGLPFDPAFTSSTASCPPARGIRLVNIGDQAATVAIVPMTSFTASGFTMATLDAGASTGHPINVFTSSACSGADLLKYTVPSNTCSAPISFNLTFSINSTTCSCS